jgi:hypothetical protein
MKVAEDFFRELVVEVSDESVRHLVYDLAEETYHNGIFHTESPSDDQDSDPETATLIDTDGRRRYLDEEEEYIDDIA